MRGRNGAVYRQAALSIHSQLLELQHDASSNNENEDMKSATSSLLPFDEKDLLAIRLLPAEFARAAGVSKQTVSRWIKQDKITLGADGRLDPNVAMRQVIKNSTPGRVRARFVKQAYSDMAGLREEASRASILEEQLAEARNRVSFLEGFAKEQDLCNEVFLDLLVDAAETLSSRAAEGRDSLRSLLEEIGDEASLAAGERLNNIFIDVDLNTSMALDRRTVR